MKINTPMKVQPIKLVPLVIDKKLKQNTSSISTLVQPSSEFVVGGGPLGARPLSEVGTAVPKTKFLKDSGGMPKCTQEQRRRYNENWENIVSPTVTRSLKRHREDVLHGGRSLNMLLPTKRPTKDWDLYSPREKIRAQTLEREIDKKTGCDICSVKQVHMPKLHAGPDTPGTSKRLYRIVTEHNPNDADVDVMDKPKDLKTISHHGITHESLESTYLKSEKRMLSQPMHMWKAMEDKKRIEEYLRMKGKKTLR